MSKLSSKDFKGAIHKNAPMSNYEHSQITDEKLEKHSEETEDVKKDKSEVQK